MSKGIGLEWYKKYYTDTYKDYLTVDHDKRTKVPRYYDKQLEKTQPEKLEVIKQEREKRAKEQEKDNTAKRRLAKSIVKAKQHSMLKRGYENEKEHVRTI